MTTTTPTVAEDRPVGLERAAWLALLAFAAALQVSIGAASVLLTLTAVLWLAFSTADAAGFQLTSSDANTPPSRRCAYACSYSKAMHS